MDQPVVRFLVAVSLSSLLVACGSQPVYYPPPVPPATTPPAEETAPETTLPSDSGEVVLALLEQSQQQNEAGNAPRSIALLERALRIAPKDAKLWLELAKRHLASGRLDLAEQFARKALLFGQSDPDVIQAAHDILTGVLPETTPVRG